MRAVLVLLTVVAALPVAGPVPVASAAEPFDSLVRATIPSLPFYSRSDRAAVQITTPLEWSYSANDAPGVVAVNVGTPAPSTFRSNWRAEAGFRSTDMPNVRARYQSTFCGKYGVSSLTVQDGAFGAQSCLGTVGTGGAIDIYNSATPYGGYAVAYRTGSCWTLSVGAGLTLLTPVTHGPRDKPAVMEAMRVAADRWIREVTNALATSLERGCGGTTATTARPVPPSTRPVPPSTRPVAPSTAPTTPPTTVRPRPRFAVAALDASPSQLQGRSLRRFTSALQTTRAGTTADGASKLLLRVTVPADMSSVTCTVEPTTNGTCSALGSDPSIADTWNLVYKPPKAYGAGGALREVPVVITATPVSGQPTVATYAVKLYRPPVVLVHGFLSSAAAWGSRTDGMMKALIDAGHSVTAADYSKTSAEPFTVNAPIVADAVKAAVEEARVSRNVAITRADVVGHSMGGLLTRLAAQPTYGAPVHRLVTLCTPHHGSDLGRVGRVVPELDLSPLGSKAGLVQSALVMADWWFGAGLTKETGASADLTPESRALKAIGTTKVPGHAVVCVADNATLTNHAVFGGLYDVVGQAFFENEGAVLDEVLRADRSGENENAERLFRILEDAYERGLDPNAPPGDTGFFAVSDPNLRAQLHQLLRAAIFGNQANDGVIRVESQAGGLPELAQTRVGGVVHTGAQASVPVQNAVILLLSDPREPGAEGSEFAKSWPVAGATTTDLPSGPQVQPPEERLAAITASNIVGAHANAISQVARESEAIIVMRPVNPSAKPLIEGGAATKGMRVKGKSSDWGPQNGYIAVDQLYSKLGSGPRDAAGIQAIGKFDCEVKQSLDQRIAEPRPLTVSRQGQEYTAMVVGSVGSGPADAYECRSAHGHPQPTAAFVQSLTSRIPAAGQPAVYLRAASGALVDGATFAPVTVDPSTLVPLLVLADPRSGLLLTADYDLLAFGTRSPDPKPSSPDPDMGFITSEQRAIVRRVNAAVAATGYRGGRVVHHGPENQFDCSEKLDYPMTAFEPNGAVYTIDPGPPGAAQMMLKRYFARKWAEGWVITPNKNWNWELVNPNPAEWDDADTAPRVPQSCIARTDDNDEILP
ncbi:MAG: hypothetical protein AMXMBFR46_08200 [Acidimicrobiia bacterium]